MNNQNSQENAINWGTEKHEEDHTPNCSTATLKDHAIETMAPREGREPSIIGFTGTKGGVGTTTVGLNVAMTLVQLGQKVIYVEMSHHFGSAAWQLGLPQTAPLEIRVPHSKEINGNFINKALMRHSTGLQVFCFSPWVDDEGHHLPIEILQTLLSELAAQAHTIILDFPLEQSKPSAFFLHQSQLVNVVMDVDLMGMTAAKAQLNFVNKHSQSPVILTGVNRTNIPPAKSVEEIEKEMEGPTFTMIPSASELCYTASTHHLPIVCIKPNSIPALQFIKLRDQILSQLKGEAIQSTRDRRGKNRRNKDRRHSIDGW